MKRTMMLSALLVLIAATTFAASNQDYLVVYDGRTSTNGHAIQFLNDYVQRHGGYHMHIMSANQAGGVNPADYRAVVVLNTGRTSGMDPAFTPIVDQWQSQVSLVTVNLESRRRTTAVETNGVDAVTAATQWRGTGLFGGTNDVYQMHLQWAQFVLDALDSAGQGA